MLTTNDIGKLLICNGDTIGVTDTRCVRLSVGDLATMIDWHDSYRIKILYIDTVYTVNAERFKVVSPTENLKDKTVCITGPLTYTREFYVKFIELHGGTFKPNITKNLSYLVTNVPGSKSSKMIKAKNLGIPVISERALLNLCTPIENSAIVATNTNILT